MKKLLSLFLALSLMLSMGIPALATPVEPEATQAAWEEMGYESMEAMLTEWGMDELSYYSYYANPAEQEGWVAAYLEANPDEAAAFDADAYFVQIYGEDMSKDEYMELFGMTTEEEFQSSIRLNWVLWQVRLAEEQTKVDAYTAAHPDEVAAFDADAYFEENYLIYFDSKEEFVSYNMIATEEEFYNTMLLSYIGEQEEAQRAKDEWAATVAAEPELTAIFLSELDVWMTESFWYSSFEEFMEMGPFTQEAAYNYLYAIWKPDYESAQQRKAEVAARITELGGTLGRINLMVDDKMVAFGDAAPMLDTDGTLLAPADALSDALGIIVKGDANGYAPVRFTAENAGWDVLWDEEHQSAVLINRNGLIGDIDAKFSELDTLYVQLLDILKREEGQSYKIDEKLSFNLTALDSLDGDKTYTASIKGTSTVKDGAISASLTLDLSGLVRQLSPAMKEALVRDFPQHITAKTIAQLLTGIQIDLILNPEDGLYIHAPILAEFSEDIDAESWLYFEMPDYISVEAGAQETPASLNLGTLLYAMNIFNYEYSYYYSAVNAYDDIMEQADTVAAFVGNDRFTAEGDNVSYKLDTKTVNHLIAKATEDDSITSYFRTAEVSANLSGGKFTFEAEVRPDTEALGLWLGSGGVDSVLMAYVTSMADFRLKTDGTVAASGSKYTMEYHQKNLLKLRLEYTSKVEKTATGPDVALPADADVVDAYELFYGFYPYNPYASMMGMLP